MGSLSTLRAASDPGVLGGQYFGLDGFAQLRGYPKVVASSNRSHDVDLRRRVWAVSELYDGNEWADGHQGDFLYVPPGGIHGFRNEADEPASTLMLAAPGAPREAYFEGFGALADMTEGERREWFIRHDNYWIQKICAIQRVRSPST